MKYSFYTRSGSTYFCNISTFYTEKNADMIIYNSQILECFLLFDWLNIFVCLRLIL